MIGYALMFFVVAALNVAFTFSAWKRGDRIGSIGNAILAPVMLALAIGALL